MKSGEEFRTLTEHIRGVMRGQILDVDAITRQQLETYGKRPLIVFLAELTLANCKIRGTRGNRPEDVLELLRSGSRSGFRARSGLNGLSCPAPIFLSCSARTRTPNS